MDIQSDIDFLKAEAQNAINNGLVEAAKTQHQKSLEASSKQAAFVAKAKEIIKEIPRKCFEASSQGKPYVTVMGENRFYDSRFVKGEWFAEITDGPGVIVFDACLKAGLKAKIEYQDDGCGINSWAEIRIYFK